ncbi:MAG: hypothetical protein ACOH5I_11460 [Oligoflexus sp.]
MMPLAFHLLLAFIILAHAEASSAQNEPSYWIGDTQETIQEKPQVRQKNHKALQNQQRKNWAVGLGVNIPDVFPIEAYWLPSRWISMRAFFVVPLPFKVRVEYGRSVLANQGGLSIENPDLTVDFDGTYGPQYGLETLLRPLGGVFYLGMGMSYRKLSLQGDLLSDLILTSSAGSIETNSLISLQARADTAQIVYRASLGWLWTFWDDQCYFNFTLFGLTLPQRAFSDVYMRAKILNPIATVEVRNEIIEEAERRFADDLAGQARDSLRPVERLVVPIIGLSGGFSF